MKTKPSTTSGTAWCAIVAVAAVLILTVSAAAQTGGLATLVGTVRDTTGAVIPGAKVIVINTGTNVRSEGVTTPEGNYYIPYLNAGTYRLIVEAPGFRQYIQEGIGLRPNETPRIDVTLEVGALTEAVTVSGQAPLLNTETVSVGASLDQDVLIKMANVQKRIVRALYYFPGAVGTTQVGYHIAGQQQNAIGYTLDGITGKTPGSDTFDHLHQTIQTTQDALEEIKVLTSGLSAEYGHSAGGAMRLAFRSGTNELHGSYEERYIDDSFVHRHYLQQLPTYDPWSYKAIDAVGSGPLWLPKIYNGKNRTFWLFGYAAHLENWQGDQRTTVPSEAMLRGDFSFPEAAGGGLPIYNPFTTRQSGSTWIRDPFPGNIIPQDLFDPVVKNFLAKNPWAKPNTEGVATRTGPTQNLIGSAEKIIHRIRWDIKVDHQISSNHKIFGRYSQAHHRAYRGARDIRLAWRDIDPNVNPQPIDNINGVLNDTYVFGPTTFNEFRIGYNRRASSTDAFTYNQSWGQKLGITGIPPETFPYFNIGYGLSSLNRSYEVGEDIVLQNNFTKIVNVHTIKAGYELIRTRVNSASGDLPSGNYSFGGTNMPYTPNTGQTFASFLLGTVTSATFSQRRANNLPRWWRQDWYVQDDWKVRPGLTLSLGLRWSYHSPYSTKYGQQSQWNPNVVDPLTGQMGAITHFKGLTGKRDLNNFQPRLGLVWNFRPKWVFRSSFGILTQDEPGYAGFEEYNATYNIVQPTGDPRHLFRLRDGPGEIRYTILPDGTVPFSGASYSSRGATWRDPNLRNPYVMNWSGGFQYEFARNWLAELTYQGTAGVGLTGTWNINEIPLTITLSGNQALLDQIYPVQQNYKPYTHFGTITLRSNFNHNTYHSGIVRLEKRYSHGLTINAFYTYSKTLTDSGAISYYARRAKTRAGYDVRHNSTIMTIYELPVGKGRRWLNRGGIINGIVGGWDLTWTQTMQSGVPISIGMSGSPHRYITTPHINALVPIEEARTPNWNIGPHRFPTSAQNPYLKASAFAYPAPYTVGSLANNVLEATGIFWGQFAIAKTWTIKERARITLRADGHNLPFKRPQFDTPSSTYNQNSLSTFGTHSSCRGAWSEFGTAQANVQLSIRGEF